MICGATIFQPTIFGSIENYYPSFDGKLFEVDMPMDGWVYTFNPNTATAKVAVSFLASVVYAQTMGIDLTVIEPSGGWVRTFDPNMATLKPFFNALATMAHDLAHGAQAWTVEVPLTSKTELSTNAFVYRDVFNFLGTYLIALNKGWI